MKAKIDLLNSASFQAGINQCIHCGMCLEACPTYAVFGTEMDSPRGRIVLMKAAAEGRIEPAALNGAFSQHLTRCLACRSCETACPSGVPYGSLVETARIMVEQQRTPGRLERLLRWLGLREALPHLGRLKWIARFSWVYQVIGLQSLVRWLDFLPGSLKTAESILPPMTLKYQNLKQTALAVGEKRGRVAFFTGCVQEAFLSPVNQATVRVLQQNGFEVHFVPQQSCCGASQLHAGDVEFALALARQNIDAFLGGAYTAVINNAGGCGLSLKEYPHLLKDDPVYAERACRFAELVKDVSEFLAENLHVSPSIAMPKRVAYVDSCHLRHGQKVVEAPRQLLQAIPDLQFVELQYPDQCCGSAGIYNIVQAETAVHVLNAKIADITRANVDIIAVSNTGCHMQLIAGVRQAGLPAKVMHVVELLDMAYLSF
ncbi:MAG: 4Fe-4S dicluster domain-containing protein [Chloroflexi bacterium]|nr:MAG: 4Fe-4S dicluster domain-containing protein [Chloroflexota bacterium]